jgi:8-oxo-dGTP pyrophosphatase MutT (NUDIX family)
VPYDALHDDADALLAFWRPPDPAQAKVRSEFVRFLSDHGDALERANPHGHLTASTLVLDARRAKVLLTLHPKLGRWLQMGGHIEQGDRTVLDAARREASEESGIPDLWLHPEPIDLDIHALDCPKGRANRHLDVRFVAIAPPGAVHQISDESDDLAWFALDDLPSGLDESVLRLIRRATA